MSNTFVTTDLVARDASIILANNLVMANLVNRNYESKFANKIGDTVSIKVPPTQTARDFVDDSSTVTDNDITESTVNLQLTEQPYVAHTLTSEEKSLELDDFNEVVTKPAVYAIRNAIDEYLIEVAAAGFAVNYAGGEGSAPSTVAHLIAGRKALQDNGCPLEMRVGILDTTAEASMLSLDQFTSADYGTDNPKALQEAALGRKYGIDFYTDQNVGTLTRGDVAEATNLAADTVAAATSLTMDDAGGTSVGTMYRGSRFVMAGDTQVYTLTADSTAAAGEFAMSVSPAITGIIVDNAAITWQTASKENVLFTRNAMAGAIVAPAPLAIGSSVAFYNGVGIRVSMSSSTASLSDQIVFDTFLGGQIVEADGGCVVGGV